MAHDVFISYSIKDKPIADGICANLEAAGVRCWIAPRDIGPGEDWPTAIARAIPQSRVMVMVFSSHSNNSDQVYRELFLAAGNNAIIIPFKIEDVEPAPRMGFILAGKHWLDAITPPLQEQINILVTCVKSFLSGVVPPPPGPKPTKRIPTWAWGTIIAVLLLAGGAAFYSARGQTTNAIPLPLPSLSPSNTPGILATQVLGSPSAPAQTDTPEIIETQALGTQSDQARAFAEPILSIVAQHKPDFEDDFSEPNPNWWFNPNQGGSIEGGSARLQVNNGWESMSDDTDLTGKDFVLQFNTRLVSGDTTSQIVISLHDISDTHGFFLNLYPAIQSWFIGDKWGSEQGNTDGSGDTNAIAPIGKTMQITIITRGSRFALYIDRTPVGFIDNNHFDNAGKNNINCVSFSPTVCEFDNIKFWNLANITGLP